MRLLRNLQFDGCLTVEVEHAAVEIGIGLLFAGEIEPFAPAQWTAREEMRST